MTIKVEREALLRVLHTKPTSTSPLDNGDSTISLGEDDYLLVDFRKSIRSQISPDDTSAAHSIRHSASDDEDSVFTLSTTSLSDDSDLASEGLLERRVSFAEELVTEEWTREYTPKEDIPKLFYSTEETQRFRQEYRMERKLMSELSIDPDCLGPEREEEISALVSSTNSHTPQQSQRESSAVSSKSSPSPLYSGVGRHRISRVVVLHNDKLETFFSPDDGYFHQVQDASSCQQSTSTAFSDDGTISSSTHHNLSNALPIASEPGCSDDFFDNDSFWSGSITWY